MAAGAVSGVPPTPTETTRPIRVAYVIQNLNFGGMERVLHGLASELPQHGFEVHVVVLEYYGHFAEGLEDRVTFHRVPPMSRLSLLHPKALATTLRMIAPDIVHTHAGVWLKGARAARLAGVRAIMHTEHGRPDPVPLADRLIDNVASRQTDMIVSVSEALAEVLRRQVVHDPSRVRVVTNGVDTRRILPASDRDSLRQALGLPAGTPIIGSIGRLEPIKNYRLALRALVRVGPLVDGGPLPMLVLVGDGSEREELEALARELDITSRVRFLGWRTDAERIYGAFDVFTLTSRNEGTSISLLEAMSAGVCPIVTDVGGNRAVVGEELRDLLVPNEGTVALAAHWWRYLASDALRKRMGELARVRVEQVYSVGRMVRQHADLYRELSHRFQDRHKEHNSNWPRLGRDHSSSPSSGS
jgi:glycosyltransferase involved in cell wall biosynthesis